MSFGQGLDPGSQFTLQLLQGLGQQIQSGLQKNRESNALAAILPGIQSAETPEDQINQLLSGILDPNISQQQKQNFINSANVLSQLSRSQETSRLRQEEIERRIQAAEEKKQEKLREKVAPVESGLQTLDRMEQLLPNLGLGSGVQSFFFGGEVAEDKAEFERLGKSLIQLSAGGLIVRSQKEFETLARGLTDATVRTSTLKGTLRGLRRILQQNLNSILPDDNDNIRVNTTNGVIDIDRNILKQERQRRQQQQLK